MEAGCAGKAFIRDGRCLLPKTKGIVIVILRVRPINIAVNPATSKPTWVV